MFIRSRPWTASRSVAPRLELLEDRTLLTGGQLDPTFGTGGKVITDFVGPVSAFASRAAIQSDGKIVVAGYSAGAGLTPHFEVARYTTDGHLDNTFGSGGQVQLDFGTAHGPTVANVAIQTDGKIIVAGTNDTGSNSAVFFVERFNPDGTLDTTFGTLGKTSAGIGSVSVALGLALQGDGKILVVGLNGSAGTTTTDFGLVRFNPDGSLDSGFGSGGKVETAFGGGFDYASAVAVQSDGKIIVGGSTFNGMTTVLALARYNSNGTLDSGFGTGGMVASGFSGSNISLYPDLALQSEGRIVLAGHFLTARFNPNGSVDTSFGTGGAVTGQVDTNSVRIQADGKIIVAGGTPVSTGSTQQFAVARYNADGSLDTTFGTGGEVATNFEGAAAANGVALQSDGKLVTVGSSRAPFAGSLTSFALARYTTSGILDTSFGTAGTVLTVFTGVVAAPANGVVVQPDGKIVVAGGTFDLVRYNPDGSLDVGFGAGGRVTGLFGGVLSNLSTANGVALQTDGKIVVVGATGTEPMQTPPPAFAVARYNADGSPDTSFGTGGIVTTSFSQFDEAFAVAIQADGKIVVVGEAGSAGDFAVARYNPDGSLDTTFGTAGKLTTQFSAGAGAASGVVLQADGKILVVGDATSGNATAHVFTAALAMARYNTDGSLDATFGTGGHLVSSTLVEGGPGSIQLQPSVALQADGRIVVAGGSFIVLRLLTNGNPDPSFGTGGSVMTDFGGSEEVRGVVIQADGKIVAGGAVLNQNMITSPMGFSQTSFALARYNPDGSLDPTFGFGGKTTTDFGEHLDTANALVLQADGKIILAGGTSTVFQTVAGPSHFAVARYLSDNTGTPNQRFVEQLYWDLLQRPVDTSGLASWSGMLDQGVSHAQIITAIQSSQEYRTRVVGYLYQLVLGRAVDPSGLSTWVDFLNRGGTAEQLESFLLGSDEFFAAHGSDITQGFLPALYQTVLQRPIDPSGAQSWSQALQSGTLSRQAVAAAVLASLESDRLEVQNLYMQFLHRAADPGGLDTFSNALQQGVSNEQVALLLMNSTEYFARA